MASNRVLFCNCIYAQVIPKSTKEGVLRSLCKSGKAFDAVADLCELSARNDSSLKGLTKAGNVKIAACFPRAVKWLFASGNAPLDLTKTQVINMRTASVEEVMALLEADFKPNLPADSSPSSTPEKEDAK